jgi:glycine dehydrogenase subunit 1
LRYIPHTESDESAMLEVVGAPDVESLFACVPQKLRLDRPLELPAAASEQEVLAELSGLASRNAQAETWDWFLGAGTYAHYIPSAVDSLVSRAEFLTSYTPYQPEISQGTLQAVSSSTRSATGRARPSSARSPIMTSHPSPPT